MPRTGRVAPGGYVYHVINRGVARLELFSSDFEYSIFENSLFETQQQYRMRICAYCIMPNHWHLALWPRNDGDLSKFMQRLMTAHISRLKKVWDIEPCGHIYQGRFKSFVVQSDCYYLNLLRYIEANPVRAGLVKDARTWKWSSLSRRTIENTSDVLDGPIDLPEDWATIVNHSLDPTQIRRLRYSINRGAPYGDENWARSVARSLGIEASLRPPGRPEKRAILEK